MLIEQWSSLSDGVGTSWQEQVQKQVLGRESHVYCRFNSHISGLISKFRRPFCYEATMLCIRRPEFLNTTSNVVYKEVFRNL